MKDKMDERKKGETKKTDWKTTKNDFSGCLIFC